MTTPAAAPQSPSPGSSAARWLLLLGLAVVVPVAGWGAYTVINRQADTISEAESEDDIAFLEIPGESLDEERPTKTSTASLTDVVPALHQESPDDAQPTIVPVAGQRPASNSPAWLVGTIEEAPEPAPPQFPSGESAQRRIDRFTRSSAR